jgi:HSP20 family protein
MRDEMNRLFERFDAGWRWPSELSRPAGRDMMVPEFDIRDDGKEIVIEADLPGVEEKDVAVTLTNGVLTIRGEKKSGHGEKKDNYYMAERSYGSFLRSLRLPDTIDENGIEARLDKGVLKVVARKRAEAVKTEKKIELKKA